MSPLFFKRLSDEILGSRLASGEAAAFDELYRRYANRLAAYGAHLLGDAGLGDDVAQATMLKAYGALREGRVPNRMKPWLFRIAHNVAIDLVVRRRELPSDDLPEAPSADRETYAGTLIEALATLPDRQRRAYVLREVHGLRIDETAAELGLTTAQVEQALFAARNRLAEQLVFGDRLNCVTVQRLAAGPLDTEERRALKTHLRACNGCRQTLGVRGRALSVFPAGMSLDWLPRLGAGLLTGGAPAAAKVGAVVATATIAAVPVAVETGHFHAHRPAVPRIAVHATPVVAIRHTAHETPAAATVAVPIAEPRAVVAVRESQHRSTSHARRRDGGAVDRGGKAADAVRTEDRSRGSGSGGDGSGEHHSGRGDSGDHGSSSSGTTSGSGDGRTAEGGHSGGSGDGGRTGGGDRGGATSTSGTQEHGDRHGGDRTTTTMTTTTTTTTGGEVDGSHGGGDGSGSGSGGGDSRDGGGGGGDSSGGSGGGSDSGGGGTSGGTVTTPDLPLLDSSGH